MAGRSIAVSILADTKELKQDLKGAEGSLKDFANEADQSADKARRSLDGVAEGADSTASAASQAAGGLGDLGGALSGLPGPLGALGTGMEAAAPAIMGVTGAADLLNLATEKFPALAKVQVVWTKAVTLAQKAMNAVMRMNPIGLVVTAILLLIPVIVLLIRNWDKVKAVTEKVWNAIKSAVSTAVDFIWNRVIKPVFGAIAGFFTTIFGTYVQAFRAVWNVVKNVTRGAFNGIKRVIGAVMGAIGGAIRGYLGVYRKVFNAIWNAVKTVTRGAFNGIKNLVTTPLNAIVTFVRGVPGKLLALGTRFKNAGKNVIGKFIEGIGRVGGAAGEFASKIWGAVKGAINNGIDKLNNLLEFDFKVKGIGFSVNAPDIPHLANGGITTGPTIAMIGDNPGGREAVIPLDKYNPFGGTTVININVATSSLQDDYSIAKEIDRVVSKYVKKGGNLSWT